MLNLFSIVTPDLNILEMFRAKLDRWIGLFFVVFLVYFLFYFLFFTRVFSCFTRPAFVLLFSSVIGCPPFSFPCVALTLPLCVFKSAGSPSSVHCVTQWAFVPVILRSVSLFPRLYSCYCILLFASAFCLPILKWSDCDPCLTNLTVSSPVDYYITQRQ